MDQPMPKFCERKFIYLENIKAIKIYLLCFWKQLNHHWKEVLVQPIDNLKEALKLKYRIGRCNGNGPYHEPVS